MGLLGDEVVVELVDRAIGDMRAEMAEADGVAVRGRVHGPRNADRTAGAGDVLDHDGLAERILHPLAEDAHHGIRGAAGGERHDHGDGAGRIGFGAGGSG
jgi:hypothetical protein